jgi:hypothetical protein
MRRFMHQSEEKLVRNQTTRSTPRADTPAADITHHGDQTIFRLKTGIPLIHHAMPLAFPFAKGGSVWTEDRNDES